ncbi:MAG: transcription factor jumonji JmjC domain-containing protein [Betaproteobacteria bacterium]
MPGTPLSKAQFDALLQRAESAPPWLAIDPGQVEAHYNRSGFLVSHRLPDHPLFTLDALFPLCRRMPPGQVKFRFGVVPGDAHFDSSLVRYNGGLTLAEAIDHLEEKRAYIAVYNPERDAEYRPVIEGLLAELGLATREHELFFNWYSTYVFISANDSVTPYHMDREMNFLLQVRGTKTVQLWDPLDDEVMRSAQRDHLFSNGTDARPPYHDGLPAKARRFELKPGLGVHHPFIAPHLVTTGPNVSVSLAITFRTPGSDIVSDAHRYNDRFRRYGLGRIPVGEHAALDATKARVMRTLRGTRAIVGRSVPFRHGRDAST